MSDVTSDLDFDGVMDKIWQGTEKGMEAACIVVEASAVRISPKKTGQLWKSITHKVEVGPNIVQGIVGANTEYAAAQEFGIPGRHDAQPYMAPGLNENRQNIINLIAQAIKGEL